MKYLHTLDSRQVIDAVKSENQIFTDYRPLPSAGKPDTKNDEPLQRT